MRRSEDRLASSALGARTEWGDVEALEYADEVDSRRAQRIRESIAAVVATTKASSVFVPLGLSHPDHIMVSDVALAVVSKAVLDTYIYMEMPYGQARPGRVRRRLRDLARTFEVEPLAAFLGDLEKKAEAVNAYGSQVKELQQGFGRHFRRMLTDPERYWRIRPGR